MTAISVSAEVAKVLGETVELVDAIRSYLNNSSMYMEQGDFEQALRCRTVANILPKL